MKNYVMYCNVLITFLIFLLLTAVTRQMFNSVWLLAENCLCVRFIILHYMTRLLVALYGHSVWHMSLLTTGG